MSSFREHTELFRLAGLTNPVTERVLTNRGFDNVVRLFQLAGGRTVVSRTGRSFGDAAIRRNRLLIEQGVPTPAILAATARSALFDFAPGTLLGDLIDTKMCSAEAWRAVGAAYHRVHFVDADPAVRSALAVDAPPIGPVERAHADVEGASGGIERILPEAIRHFPALHRLIDLAAHSFRSAPVRLLHGDVNMWNVLVDGNDAWLIDWDDPAIGDPAMEIALLETHASLFNGLGLDAAFFEGYGPPPVEPNTSLYRLISTLSWAASSDWDNWDRRQLSDELRHRTGRWLQTLLAYLSDIELHIERIRQRSQR